ncbi:MAG TPA: pyridoxal phosphate-dependent aminotransferase [Polyangiaceae bacterium]|jgi:aspartate aminotransferase/aminotransferase
MTTIVDSISQAGSIRINQLATEAQRAGRDVTVLSLGEAFFDIPMYDLARIDFTRGYHYSDSRGLPSLRRRIADSYLEEHGVAANPETNVLVSTGSKMCVYLALMALLEPGDEVLVHEPYWLSYPAQVRLARGVSVAVPHWTRAPGFAEHFTPRTRVVILNNPNNPAGSVYGAESLRHIYEQCRRHGATLLVDEAYSEFVLDGSFTTSARLDPGLEDLVIVNSFSKNMGMSGWRLGYMLAHEKLMADVLKLNQHLVTCAPTLLQMYCDTYFEEIRRCVAPQIRAVVEKRRRIQGVMDRLGLRSMSGASTFYFLVDIAGSGLRSEEYSERLLREHSIAVVPGRYYGESTDRFVRVGVGTESEARIEAALEKMRDTLGPR